MDYMTKKRIIALFFPTRCPVCSKVLFPHEDFCTECRNTLTEYNGDFNISGAVKFVAPFEYNEKISPAIILMKKGIKGNAAYALGTALADCLENHGIPQKIDVIVPVPMYFADKRRRGFNQAELIAKEVGRILKINVYTDCVEKIRLTEAQKNLTKRQRHINLRNAFEVKYHEKIHQKRILIIDDVCTTGSTLAELTRLLLKNGAAEIYCASCCKTPNIMKEDEKK